MFHTEKRSYISLDVSNFCTLKRYIEGHVFESMMCECGGGAFKDTSKAEGPLVAFCRKLERVKKLREGCQNL